MAQRQGSPGAWGRPFGGATRRAPLLLAVFLAGCARSGLEAWPETHVGRRAPKPFPSEPVIASSDIAPGAYPEVAPPPSPPSVADRDPAKTALKALKALLASISPGTAGEATLLLGIHSEEVESYGPLYGEGKPVVSTKPGYRTIVVHASGTSSEAAPALPYLTIPQAHGFVFASEASVSIDDTDKPIAKKPAVLSPSEEEDSDEGMPRWFSATEIVTTPFRATLPALERRAQTRLRKKRSWGATSSQSILFATPAGYCRFDSVAQWTGGALAFQGDTSESMVATKGTIETRIAQYVDRTRLEKFAARVLRQAGPFAENEDGSDALVDVDTPVDVGFGRYVDFTKNAHACVGREEGRTVLRGAVVLSGNSSRSFTAEETVSELPSSFGSSSGARVDFGLVKAAFPAVKDATLSPSGETLVILDGDTVRIFDVRSEKQTSIFVGESATLVMIEWAEGEKAALWAASLR